jgi:hypothetical protein
MGGWCMDGLDFGGPRGRGFQYSSLPSVFIFWGGLWELVAREQARNLCSCLGVNPLTGRHAT